MRKIISLFFLCFVFFACQNETANEVNQEYGNIPQALIDSLQQISGKNQEFSISTDTTNTVVGKQGTILIIPKNAIVDKDGKPVQGGVTIWLKENFTMKDFITANLQTIHNNQILVSKGMVYFSAQDKNGNELKIADNNSIRIQIPQKDLDNNAKIFLGDRDPDGLINWAQQQEPAKTLTPYPIKYISDYNNTLPMGYTTECRQYYGISTKSINPDQYNYFGEITDFENTLLATKEFAERYNYACWPEVLKIYIDNLDKNLWEVDNMAVDYFIKDSTERVNYWLKDTPIGIYGRPPTQQQKEAHEWLIQQAKENGHYNIQTFRNFASQKLTKVDSTKLIDVTKLKKNNSGELRAIINDAMITYDAMEFGWVNVDYFYNDPLAKPIKLIAKTNQEVTLINLLFKNRNIILSGSKTALNEYWFTKNSDGFNKLPKGEKATIIAIGYNNKLQFAEKEIIIGQNEIEKLNMKPISGKDLKLKLEKLNRE